MSIIHSNILQSIIIILGIAIIDWIVNSFIIEEKQNYVRLITTTIGLIFILYMSVKLIINISSLGGIN